MSSLILIVKLLLTIVHITKAVSNWWLKLGNAKPRYANTHVSERKKQRVLCNIVKFNLQHICFYIASKLFYNIYYYHYPCSFDSNNDELCHHFQTQMREQMIYDQLLFFLADWYFFFIIYQFNSWYLLSQWLFDVVVFITFVPLIYFVPWFAWYIHFILLV